MDHRLVQQIEKALGFSGPQPLGTQFSIGHMPDPVLPGQLLTPTGLLDILCRRSVDYPQLRCLRDGQDLHPRDYLTTTTTGRGQVIRSADLHRIGNHLKDGTTLVLDDLGTLDVVMEVACRALSWWSGELTRVNCYLTTQQASGWGLHWDSHDVLCVQLAGQKSWEVRGPSRIAPMDRDLQPNTTPNEEIVWSGTMQAGDVMHIPRGWWHQATRDGSGEGFSLHATFGLTQRTGVDWLTWLADQARADERFRRDLHWPDGPDTGGATQRELVDAAARLMAEHGPADYLTDRRHTQPSGRHVTTLGVFGPPEAVVCVTAFPPSQTTRDDEVVITAAGKKITLPAQASPALELLLSGNPTNVKDVTTTTNINAVALARALIEQGICAELTPGLTEGYASMIDP